MKAAIFSIAILASGAAFAQSGADTEKAQRKMGLAFFGYDTFEKSRTELASWLSGSPESMRNAIPESLRIPITVSGEAFRPGRYLLPADSRAIEAIIRVGGPAETGSLRSIRIRRTNGNITTLDLYPFLNQGDMRSDFGLQGGETIEFMPVGPRVSIGEGFARTGVFEVQTNERLSQALSFGKGPAKFGIPQIVRVEGRSGARIPMDVPLDEVGKTTLADPGLLSGDEISILATDTKTQISPVYGFGFFEDARKQADLRRGLATPFGAGPSTPRMPLPNTDRYQLGPGDLIKIRILSTTEETQEIDVRVDAAGNIAVPITGKVRTVRGQTTQQLQTALNADIRQYRRNAKVEITLAELRSMSITVMGEVYAPGSYEVPAVATLFQMLHMAGGPTENGSFRSIQLRRAGAIASTFDLYDFLLFGDPRQDKVLQPGDVIFIPPTGPRINLQGEFLRPGKYEITQEDKFRDVLKLGGGLKATAVSHRVAIESVRPGQAKVLVDVNTASKEAVDNPPLFDGDTVKALSVRPETTNQITVEGAVDQPGDYALKQGMRVSDLVTSARGTLPEASLERADLFRRNPDLSTTLIPIDLRAAMQGSSSANPKLQPYDRVVIYSQKDLAWTQSFRVEVFGAVRRPGVYTRSLGMRVQDLLRIAGGAQAGASENGLFLQRYDSSGKPSALFRLQLTRIAQGDPEHNLLVEDRDVLSVYTVEQASFQMQAVVEVRGAVQRPGFYPRSNGMTLDDLIALAGGLLPDAGSTAEIAGTYKPSSLAAKKVGLGASESKLQAMEDGDVVTIPSDASKRAKVRTVTILGAVARPGPYTLSDSEQSLSGLIQRSGGFGPNAFPLGAQFLRKPEHLVSPSQKSLAPQIIDALAIVNDAEYKRAVAQADLQKLQAIRNVASANPSLSVPGLGSTETQSNVPLQGDIVKAVLDRQTVTQARPLTESDFIPAGNLNVHLERAVARPGGADDVMLMDGDIILIPERPSSVSVAGALVLPSAVLYAPGKTVQYYVERSGGTTLDAALDQMLVIKANGLVVKANFKTKVDLGDMIFIPTKVMALRLGDQQSNLEKAGKALSNGAIVYAIIKSILR